MPTPGDFPEFRLFRQAINAYVDLLEDRDEFAFESTTTEDISADLDAAASLWEANHTTPTPHSGDSQ
jgi:cation diffusion facilitator CzcD-associated flavoprotein CzcO